MAEIAAVEVRIPSRQGLGENRQIARAGVSPSLVGPAIGRPEVRVAHAEFGGVSVHQREPRIERSHRRQRQRHSAIVGRDRGHTKQ
jgi:hypothetical protein